MMPCVPQAYLSLLSTLPEPALTKLRSLPPEWVNTLQYAWEQGIKRKRRVRQQEQQQLDAVSPLWAAPFLKARTQSPGGLQQESQDMTNSKPPVHATGGVTRAHRELCSTLDDMGLPGAQSERFIKVAGFLIEADVTLQASDG